MTDKTTHVGHNIMTDRAERKTGSNPMRLGQMGAVLLLCSQLACVTDGSAVSIAGPARVPPKPIAHTPLYATRAPKPPRHKRIRPSPWMPASHALSSRWTCIVIHHSATNSGNAKLFDKFHRSKGWQGLGYHFVIGNGTDSPDGQVEIGARWHQQIHGAHCKTDSNYYNEHGIGICLVGDFTKSSPTAKQMASLRRLVAFLTTVCHIPPDRVTTHRAVTGKTACPGRKFPIRLFKHQLKTALAHADNSIAHPRVRPMMSAAAKYRMHSTAADGGPMGRSSR